MKLSLSIHISSQYPDDVYSNNSQAIFWLKGNNECLQVVQWVQAWNGPAGGCKIGRDTNSLVPRLLCTFFCSQHFHLHKVTIYWGLPAKVLIYNFAVMNRCSMLENILYDHPFLCFFCSSSVFIEHRSHYTWHLLNQERWVPNSSPTQTARTSSSLSFYFPFLPTVGCVHGLFWLGPLPFGPPKMWDPGKNCILLFVLW